MFKFVILLLATLNLAQNVMGQCTKTYVVGWGDYCTSIAKNAGLSFPTFIALNKPIDCSLLQAGQTLCLARVGFTNYPSYPCTSVYQIPMTLESCETIAAKNSMSVGYLSFYNPGLDCTNLQKGQEICTSISSATTSTAALVTSTTPIVTASSQCLNVYTVRWGDYCSLIAKNAGMSFPTFIALNKPIDCSLLQAGQTLCLARAGFVNYPIVPCTSVYQMPMYYETCETVAAKNGLTVSLLMYYNPGLDCANLQKGQEFCLSSAGTTLSPSTPTAVITTGTIATTKPSILTTIINTTAAPVTSIIVTQPTTTTGIIASTTKAVVTTAAVTTVTPVATTSAAAATNFRWDPIKMEFVWY